MRAELGATKRGKQTANRRHERCSQPRKPILSGGELSPDVVIQMNAWFARHEVDKKGKGFSPGDDYPSLVG
jgi:hypothetical protein